MKKPLNDWSGLKRYMSSTWGQHGIYSVYLKDDADNRVTMRKYNDPGPRIEIYGNGRLFGFPQIKSDDEVPVMRVRVKYPLTGLRFDSIGEKWAQFNEGPVPLNGNKFYLSEMKIKRIIRQPGFLRRFFGASEKVIYEASEEKTA